MQAKSRWTRGAACAHSFIFCAALLALAACGKTETSAGGGGSSGGAGAGGSTAAGGAKPAATAAASKPAGAGELKLVIVTPHNEFIQKEFENAFNEVYGAAHSGDKVAFEWQKRGSGTAEMVKYVNSTYEALGEQKDQGIGIDIVFGGGTDAFASIKKNGNSEAVALKPETLAAVPADLGGVPLRDADNHWVGTALSSFGIIYNKTGLKTRNLPEPKTWADLANPAYMGQLVLGDPSKSSSSAVCYEVILQKEGWEKGWGMLMEIAGNTRTFADSSSQVPRDVAQGSAIAGMCIDFYAYNEIQEQGEETIGYVGPANATAVTPDPIGLLRGAPHRAIATEFVEFVLSKKGQALWCLPAGQQDGPKEHGLWRTPIRPDVFKDYHGKMLMSFDPFEAAQPFNLDMKLSATRSPLIGPLFLDAFLKHSAPLKEAWAAVQKLPEDHPARVKFRAVPFAESELDNIASDYAANQRSAIAYDSDWQKLFRERYREVVEAAK